MFSMVQLECFLAVAEELHFGQAADRLQMTQPPLSRHIQQIERTLGTALFLRSSRHVELTAAGRALLPRARQIIDLAAKTQAEVRSVSAGTAGTLTIGYTAMAGLSILPELIQRKREELPGVRLILRELASTDQVDELARGTVDLALMRPFGDRRPGIVSRRVFEEELVLAVPADWPQASGGTPILLSALEGSPFIMYSPGESRYLHDLLRTIFREQEVRPRIMQYAGQIMAILALVGVGLGCALVPASARDIATPRIALLPVRHKGAADTPRISIELAWNPETVTPLARAMIAIAVGGGEPPAAATGDD